MTNILINIWGNWGLSTKWGNLYICLALKLIVPWARLRVCACACAHMCAHTPPHVHGAPQADKIGLWAYSSVGKFIPDINIAIPGLPLSKASCWVALCFIGFQRMRSWMENRGCPSACVLLLAPVDPYAFPRICCSLCLLSLPTGHFKEFRL